MIGVSITPAWRRGWRGKRRKNTRPIKLYLTSGETELLEVLVREARKSIAYMECRWQGEE